MGASVTSPITRLGAWEAKDHNTVYQAATDGFVIAFGHANVSGPLDQLLVGPVTMIQRGVVAWDGGVNTVSGTISCLIPKGNYWEFADLNIDSVYWLPIL